jgi:hypothetical protein
VKYRILQVSLVFGRTCEYFVHWDISGISYVWNYIKVIHKCVTYEGGPKNNRNRPVAHACFLVTSCAAR